MRIRSLTEAEKSTLHAALVDMAHVEGKTFSQYAWSAQAMLEQRFVDNLMWIENYGKEEQ